jgi:hypothetical protein
MAANGLFLPAFLAGVANVVRAGVDPSAEYVRPRPGQDGRPLGAYRGGGWFYGVYWASMSGAWGPSHEAFEVSLSCGVDITRVFAKSGTREAGPWFLQDGEIYERAAYVAQLLLDGRSGVARACQSALSELTAGDPDGLFREHFDTVSTGPVRTEDPVSWMLAADPDPAAVYVCSLRFSGLTFHKLYSEVPTT